MAYNPFYLVERGVPSLRKAIWRSFYGLLARRFTMAEWTFMNYGYLPLDGQQGALELDQADEADRTCIQLYAHLFDNINLQGLDMLEVGSGRGGGSAWIARTQGVKSMTGIDLAESAVQFCRQRHKADNLRYLQGDAENLPLDDNSVDVVINVESCHHYPDLRAFFREVHRVLKPGGYFCVTDYRELSDLPEFHAVIENSPFKVISKADITDNVVAALDHDDSSKRKLINETVPAMWRNMIEHFAAIKGTDMYDRFASKQMPYETYQLRKS